MFLHEAPLCFYPGYLQMQLFITQIYSVGCFCLISVGSYCSCDCLFSSHTGWSYISGLSYEFLDVLAETLEGEGLKMPPRCCDLEVIPLSGFLLKLSTCFGKPEELPC